LAREQQGLALTPRDPVYNAQVERQDECLDPDDLVALLHERLAPASQRAMEKHIAGCSDCRTLVSALAQAESRLRLANLDAARVSVEDVRSLTSTSTHSDGHPELTPGTRVGRYVVTTRLGAGAMGSGIVLPILAEWLGRVADR